MEWLETQERIPLFNPSISLLCDAHVPAPEPKPIINVDPATALACEAGDGPACVAAAKSVAPTGAYRVHLTKEEADRREQETAKYAALGCDLDQAHACALLADFGPWRDRDVPLARACELGHACSCAALGRSLTTLGQPEDAFRRGLELLERACEAGHRDDDPREPGYTIAHAPGHICDYLEGLHARGRESVLEPSPSRAAKYRRLACEQGYMYECPCKRDEDCGGEPYFCLESSDGGTCVQPSDCGNDPDEDVDSTP